MVRRRFLVEIPLPATVIYRRHGPIFKFISGGSVQGPGRRRRAAGDDLWRSCQTGGDCPDDIRRRYTQTTVADQILKWGSGGVFFGGLGIGTGTGAATTAGQEAGVVFPWAEGGGRGTEVPWAQPGSGASSNIPRERPFSLPGADIPVSVDEVGESPLRPGTAPNTFVNPAFDGDIISVASGDNVVVGDPVPLPDPHAPEIDVPEGPFTRGDTFVYEHEASGTVTPDRRIFFPTLSEPPPSAPFEELELAVFGGGRGEAPAVRDSAVDLPLTSTPDPAVLDPVPRRPPARAPTVMDVHIDNPLFDPDLTVDAIYSDDVEAWLSDERPLLSDPVYSRARSGRVAVSRAAGVAGMALRSGTRLPLSVNFVGELSSIAPNEPLGIELRSLVPTGATDIFVEGAPDVETSFSTDITVPWHGSSLPDTSDVVQFEVRPWSGVEAIPLDEGFVDVPLTDPFPEMEIIEDDQDGAGVTVDLGRLAVRGTAHPVYAVTPTPQGARPRSIVPSGGGGLPPPNVPGVPVVYAGSAEDTFLFWWFWRRRRRRHKRFFRFR